MATYAHTQMVHATADISKLVKPSNVYTVEVNIEKYNIQYVRGQRVALAGIQMPVLAPVFCIPQGTPIVSITRSLKVTDGVTETVEDVEDSRAWRRKKDNNVVRTELIRYPDTPIFNAEILAKPFVDFFKQSGLEQSGLSFNLVGESVKGKAHGKYT